VSVLALSRYLHRQRHRLAVVALVLFVAATVVAAHSVLTEDHMGHGEAMCLAVLGAGAGAIAIATALGPSIAARPPGRALVPAAPDPRRVVPCARAGPPHLQVFLL
jgi:uncharacterized membrane protein